MDPDILDESNRIINADIRQITINEPLVVKNLIKRYKKNRKSFNAVNNLSFGVQQSECFG